MELALLVWFGGVAQGLSNAFTFVGFMLSFLSIAGYVFWNTISMTGNCNTLPPKKRYAIPVIFLCLSTWIVGLLIPDQKTIYMAAGAYMGQKVVQSETADKVVKILNSKLDEYLAEIEEKTKK